MKVKEFINQINEAYDPDDELNFTVAIGGRVFEFDHVSVFEKDSEGTEINFRFNEDNENDVLDTFERDVITDIYNDLILMIEDYFYPKKDDDEYDEDDYE